MDEHSFLISEFTDKEAREQYASDLLDSYIALQIKTLRQQRGWSQEDLAALAGKHQSQISAMEQIDFRSWKISTLQRLADAFDLALVVSFESFGTFLREILPVERAALERLSFADDPEFKSSASLGAAVLAVPAAQAAGPPAAGEIPLQADGSPASRASRSKTDLP